MLPSVSPVVLCAVVLLSLTVGFSHGSTVLMCGSDSYDPSNGGTMFRRMLDDLAVDYELLPSLAEFPDLSTVAGLQLVIVSNECADPAQIDANVVRDATIPVLVAKANANLLDKVGISDDGVFSNATVASATALVSADDPLNAGLDTDPVSFGSLTFGTVPVANLPGGARVVLSPSDDPSSAIMVAVEAGEPLFLASAVGTRLFFAPTTDAVPGVGDPSGYARAAIGWLLRRLVIHPVTETVVVGQPFEVDFDIVDVDGNPDAVTWGVSDVRFGLSVRSGASLSVIRPHRGYVGRDGGSFSFIITEATSDSANLTMWCSGAADVTSCHRSAAVPLLVTAVQPQELAIHSVLPASLAANVGGGSVTISGTGLGDVAITIGGEECVGGPGSGMVVSCSCCGTGTAGPPGPVDLVITDGDEVADFPMHFLAVPTPSEIHVTPAMVHVDTDGGLKIEIYTAGNGSLGASASDVEAVNYGGVDILSSCTFDGLPVAVVCTLPVDLGSHGDEVALTIDLIHADPIMVPIKVVGSPVIDSVDYDYTTVTLTLGLTNGVVTDIVTELVRAEDGSAFPCSTVSTNPVETTCTVELLPLPASGSYNYYPRVTTPGGTAISRTLIPVTPQVTTVSVSKPNNVVGGIFRITDTTAVIECSVVAHSCDPDNVESITVNGMPVDIVSSDGSGFTVNMTKAMLSSAGDVVFDVFLFSDYRAGLAEPAVVSYLGVPSILGLGPGPGRATAGPFYGSVVGEHLGGDISISVNGVTASLPCVSTKYIGFEYNEILSGTVDVNVTTSDGIVFTLPLVIDDGAPYIGAYDQADNPADSPFDYGPTGGGKMIGLRGYNLDSGVISPLVFVENATCTLFGSPTSNEINCLAPEQQAAGPALVFAVFDGGVVAAAPCPYVYHDPPVVTSASNVHPLGVPVAASTNVFISGENLETPLDVLVGGYACISVSYSSDTNQVACELPTSFPVDVVKSYNVTVVTPGGETIFEGAFNVTDQLAFPETVSLSHSDDGQPWNVTLPGHFLGNGDWIFGSHTCVYLEDAVNGIVCEFAGGVAVASTTGMSADGREMPPGWPSWDVTIFAQPELLSVDRMPGTDDIALTVRGDDYDPITGVQIDGQTCTNFEYHVYFPITNNVITCTPPVLPDPTVADISFSVTAGGGDFGTDGQRDRYYRGVVPASVVSPLGGSPIPSYQPTNLTLAVAPEFFAEDADQIVTVRVGGEKCDVVEVIDGDSVGVSSLTCTVPGRSAAAAANTSVEIATVWGEALFDLGTSFESCQAGADAMGGNCAACMSMAPACGWCAEAETCEASGACIAATVCPVVDSIDVVTGPSEGRTLVTVNVVNATVLSETGTRCLIDGQEVVPEAVTATGVECLTPPHAAGTVSVQLTTAAGDLVDANGVDFVYYDCSAMYGTCRTCAADARCGWCERAGACAGAATGACGDDIVGAAGSCPTAVSLSPAIISTDIGAPDIVVDVTGFGPSREPILCAYSSLPSGPANVSARFVSPTQVACPAVPEWTSVTHGGTFGVRLVKASDPNYGGTGTLSIDAAVCSSVDSCSVCESIALAGACVWCRDDDSCVGAHMACSETSCSTTTPGPSTTSGPSTTTAPTTASSTTLSPTTTSVAPTTTTTSAPDGGPTPDRPFEGLSGTIGCETTRSCVSLVPNVTTPHCHNGACLLLEIECVDDTECPPESGLTCRSRNGTTLCLSPCLIEDDDRTVLLIIMLGTVGGLTVILTLAALIGRWKIKAAEGSNVWVILAIGIAVGDLVSDIFFVTGLAGIWFWIGASALALPTLVNIIVIGVFWAMEVRSTPSMVTYNEKYTTPAAAIMILSLVNLEALGLLTSRIFGVKALDAPFSPRGQTILRFGRLTNTIFEDCVQLALVVMVTRECSDWELVGLLSVCFGVLSVVMTLFTRFMFCIGRCTAVPVPADGATAKPGGIDGQGMARADDGVGRERVSQASSSTSGSSSSTSGTSSSSSSSGSST